MGDETHSCRLYTEEKEHLNRFWKGKFSDFVHSAFKQDIQKVKTNKKKDHIQQFGQNLIFLGFGVIILFQMFNLDFMSIGWFVVFALGMCFFGVGLYGLVVEVKPRVKRGKRSG